MKYILLFLILLLQSTINAQNRLYPERTIEIAVLENDKAIILDFLLSDLTIVPKIKRILTLGESKIDLFNQTIKKENNQGWIIQYEFKFSNYAGVYKEFLKIKDNKLVITESRNAVMAMASNCNRVELTNDENRSKCVNKINPSIDSEITYRMFTSNR